MLLFMKIQFSWVQSLSCVRLFVTPSTAARQSSLLITNSQSLFKVMSIELVMPSNNCILCHPLLLPPSTFPSIRGFSNESVLCIRWPKYWSFSFSISPSKEYSGLISFRMDWLHLLAVQGTLKSLLKHHSSKASVLQCIAFFMAKLSHLYMTNGKTIALTRHTFVSKVMSLQMEATSLTKPNKQQQKHPPYFAMQLLLLLHHFSRFRLCATPETTAQQAPPSLGFSRKEHWSGLPFPSPMHESEKWKWRCSVVSNS